MVKINKDNYILYLGDCRDIDIPEVDHIFTDPPYHKKNLHLSKALFEMATRILKPTGFLMVYFGSYWKDDFMAIAREYLDYYMDCILVQKQSSILWPRNVLSRQKSILVYTHKGANIKARCMVHNLYNGNGQAKDNHEWEQPVEEARYYLDCFTHPGEAILDPFMGSGTTGEACGILARKFIGIEKDKVHFLGSSKRIETAYMQKVMF